MKAHPLNLKPQANVSGMAARRHVDRACETRAQAKAMPEQRTSRIVTSARGFQKRHSVLNPSSLLPSYLCFWSAFCVASANLGSYLSLNPSQTLDCPERNYATPHGSTGASSRQMTWSNRNSIRAFSTPLAPHSSTWRLLEGLTPRRYNHDGTPGRRRRPW